MRAKSLFIVILGLSILLVLAGWQSVLSLNRAQQNSNPIVPSKEKKPMFKKLTPVLFVKEIEPVLPF